MSRVMNLLAAAALWASIGAAGCAMEPAEGTETEHQAVRAPTAPALAPFPFGGAAGLEPGDGEPEPEACSPTLSGWVKGEVRGCWSILPRSRVQLWYDEVLVKTGRAFTWLPADDCAFDMVLVAALADRPTLRLEDLAVEHEGESRIERWVIPTGLLRARAFDSFNRVVTGPARIHRIGPDGEVDPTPAGTIALNGRAREISAGHFELRHVHRGRLLVGRVTVGDCGHRLVTLRPVD